MNDWITTHEIINHATETQIVTQALELPHGCLVRTIVHQRGRLLGHRNSVAQTFVPNLTLECHADTVAFKHKP